MSQKNSLKSLTFDLTSVDVDHFSKLIKDLNSWSELGIEGVSWVLNWENILLLPSQAPKIWNRVVKGKDFLLPQGWTGLPGSALFCCEWQKECLWPWTTGLDRIEAQLPQQARLLLVNSESWLPHRPLPDSVQPLWIHKTGAGSQLVKPLGFRYAAAIRLNRVFANQLTPLSEIKNHLWITFDNESTGKEFHGINFNSYSKVLGVKTLDFWLSEGRKSYIHDYTPSFFTPEHRLMVQEVADLRARSDLKSAQEPFFYRLAPTQIPPPLKDKHAGVGGVAQRSLVSSMQSSGELQSGDWLLHFLDGKLQTIHTVSQKNWLVELNTRLEYKGASMTSQVISAFSIEGEDYWGLRNSSRIQGRLQGQEGLSVVDYLFTEDSPDMVICQSIRYPRVEGSTPLHENAPCELVLWECRNHPISVTVYCGGSKIVHLLQSKAQPLELAGTDLVFSLQGMVKPLECFISFPQNRVTAPCSLTASIQKRKGKNRLVLSVFGYKGSIEKTSTEGWEEHFSIIFGEPRGRAFPYHLGPIQTRELMVPQTLKPR